MSNRSLLAEDDVIENPLELDKNVLKESMGLRLERKWQRKYILGGTDWLLSDFEVVHGIPWRYGLALAGF